MSSKNCMLASTFKSDLVVYPAYADPKLDGVRCIATVKRKQVVLMSRNEKQFLNYKHIEDELMSLPHGVYDGEITCGHFQELQTTVHRKNDIELSKSAKFTIFDTQDEFASQHVRTSSLYALHAEVIKTLESVQFNYGRVVDNENDLTAFYECCLRDGFEGVMVKNLHARYEFKRSKNWLKLKPTHTVDMRVIEAIEGRGKYVGNLGALRCEGFSSKSSFPCEVKVGSGFTDEQRTDLWSKRKQLLGKVIEIKYQEQTLEDSSLRFPVFLKFRPDKDGERLV